MKKLLLFILAVSLCTVAAKGAGTDKLHTDELRRALPEQARSLLTADNAEDSFFRRSGALLQGSVRVAERYFPAAIRSAIRILLVTAVCCAVRTLGTAHVQTAVSLAGAAGITACFAGDLSAMLQLGQRTVMELSDLSKLLIPTMASASALAGAMTSSAAVGSLTTVLMQLLVQLLERFALPLSGVYVALCTAASGLAQESLRGLSSAVGGLLKHGIRVILFLFTAYLSLTGILSESSDAVALRAAKMTVTASVPVAGSVLSEASSSILAGAAVLRNSIGVFGMLCVLSILLAPFLRLALHYLVLRCTAFCCAALGGTEQGKLVHGLADTLSFLLAATAGCGAMVLVSCVCFVRLRVA